MFFCASTRITKKNRQHKTQLTFWFGEQDNPQNKQMFYRHATATRRSTQDRLLLGEMRAALEQQHGGFCSEKLCRYSLQLCRNAISGTRARSLLLLLGLRHVLFTLVYLISWLKRCMALAGLPHSGSCWRGAALQLAIRSTCSSGSGQLRHIRTEQHVCCCTAASAL